MITKINYETGSSVGNVDGGVGLVVGPFPCDRNILSKGNSACEKAVFLILSAHWNSLGPLMTLAAWAPGQEGPGGT